MFLKMQMIRSWVFWWTLLPHLTSFIDKGLQRKHTISVGCATLTPLHPKSSRTSLQLDPIRNSKALCNHNKDLGQITEMLADQHIHMAAADSSRLTVTSWKCKLFLSRMFAGFRFTGLNSHSAMKMEDSGVFVGSRRRAEKSALRHSREQRKRETGGAGKQGCSQRRGVSSLT